MDIKKLALQSILKAIDELNESFPQEKRLTISNETLLFGNNGNLDSLAFMNLIISIEQHIQNDFDVSITIADEKALSKKQSPFESIETLTNYITLILYEKLNS